MSSSHSSKSGVVTTRLIETPYRNMMLDRRITKIEERFIRHKLFLSQEMVWCEVWSRVFRKVIVINDNFNIETCSQLLIQMNGCNILFSHNM